MNASNIIYTLAAPKDELVIFDLLKNLEGDRSNFDLTRFCVAKDGNKLVGCIRTKDFGNNCLELASLAVDEEYRHQGIGSSLVKELLIKEQGHPIFLLTSADKEVFYKKFGFNIISPLDLPVEFKKEYDRIINLPFAKNLQVIAMTIS
ncbi:MAG: GNAT family N-acetyltransferase [Patescibacteria group bacterium]